MEGHDQQPVRNGFRLWGSASEVDPNNSVHMPKSIPVRSETVRNDSENAPDLGLLSSLPVRNDSVAVRNPAIVGSEERSNDAEGSIPTTAESFRTAPVCPQIHDQHSITVREAARIFEEAGVPRTERAITNWCNRNARGVVRLDCCYDERERKYDIAPASIDRVVGRSLTNPKPPPPTRIV